MKRAVSKVGKASVGYDLARICVGSLVEPIRICSLWDSIAMASEMLSEAREVMLLKNWGCVGMLQLGRLVGHWVCTRVDNLSCTPKLSNCKRQGEKIGDAV